MIYRREIDGLRALAVLPVILFHAGFETFSGGFVGVDVFFVISGYLITTIILIELEQGKFSIVNFYERRARRILPALFLVMLVCLPFAWLFLLPSYMKDFTASLIAVSVYASNFLFWQESGYFDAAAELKPLLHTWSLAVEEQFYLLFPLFLMLFWRIGKRWLLIIMTTLLVASLVLAQWGSHSMPAATFFLLPTRGWELLMGSITALYMVKADRIEFSRKISELCGWLGVALIFYAIFSFSQATPFPSIYALVPTTGTVLIIIFSNQKTTIGRFIGNKVFVGIGLISYSAYLWHQPLFAFAKHISISEPSHSIFAILSIASLVLAYLSWRFVEVPFRSRTKVGQKSVFTFALLGTVFFMAVGLLGQTTDGFSDRYSFSKEFSSQFERVTLRSECLSNKGESTGDIPFCVLGNQASHPTVALFGDSHADMINPILDKLANDIDIAYTYNGLGGCLPLLNVDVLKGNWNRGVCQKIAQRQFEYVRDHHIKTVILVARWSLYTQGEYDKETTGYYLSSADSITMSRAASRDVFKIAFIETVNTYKSLGAQVFVLYQVPQQKVDAKRAYAKLMTMKDQDNDHARTFIDKLSVSHADHIALQSFNRSFFSSLDEMNNVIFINPDDYFCQTDRCALGTTELSFYRDDDHLNISGLSQFAEVFRDILILHDRSDNLR